ncbi:hypothetical protein [Flavobacterium alkalisoli]|uniref:hypothetical protein n=1 Tax=Flavobacterium alkalisoli TaxID=2602769 RepID=UPI003A9473D7
MAKRNKIILLIAAFGCFIAIMLYTSTSPQKTVDNIKRGYSGIVVSKQQIAERKSHLTDIYFKDDGVNMSEVFRQGLDSVIEVGDSIIKPKNDNYLYIIKPGGTKETFIYTYISESYRNDFRWPDKWKEKWPEASR